MRLALHWQILIAMVGGAVGGLLLNGTLSTSDRTFQDAELPAEAQQMGLESLELHDSSNQIRIVIVRADGRQELVVDATSNNPDEFKSLDELWSIRQ